MARQAVKWRSLGALTEAEATAEGDAAATFTATATTVAATWLLASINVQDPLKQPQQQQPWLFAP